MFVMNRRRLELRGKPLAVTLVMYVRLYLASESVNVDYDESLLRSAVARIVTSTPSIVTVGREI